MQVLQGRIKCHVCWKIHCCWQWCLAGDTTSGLSGDDCVWIKKGLGDYRKRSEEWWWDPELTQPQIPHFSLLPELLIFHQEAGWRVLIPEKAGTGGACALSVSRLGVLGRQGEIWLCPFTLKEMKFWVFPAGNLLQWERKEEHYPFPIKKPFFNQVILEIGGCIINPYNTTSLENSTEYAIFSQKVSSFLLLSVFQAQHFPAHQPQHQMRNVLMCRRGLQGRYQVSWPCSGKPCSSLLKGGPQSHSGQLQTCCDLCCLFVVSVPRRMSWVWGCLGPCLQCMERGGDGTCHCRAPLWAPPSQEGLNRPWDDCTAQFIPGSTGIQVFPSAFAPAGCSGGECAPLGCPCCRVIPGRQTDRVLKIKLKEDCKWQKSWRQDFQRAQFVRKTAAFYSMPGMADGRDIWHLALIEWQVGRRQTETL